MRRFPPWMCCRHEEEQIKLSEVPASTVSYVGTGRDILPDSFSQLVDIESLNLGGVSPAWSSAEVDALLIDAATAVIADAGHFTKAAINLYIGSGNGAPSGTWQSPSGDGGVPVSGLEAIWTLAHNASHRWKVYFTGGSALTQGIGNPGDQIGTSYSRNYIYGYPFIITNSMVLCEFWVSSLGSCNAVVGIYSDVSGVPTSLLVSVGSTALSNGITIIHFAAPLSLVPGTYWLALNTNVNNKIGIEAVAGYPFVYKSIAYGSLPSTFPSGYSSFAGNNPVIKAMGLVMT